MENKLEEQQWEVSVDVMPAVHWCFWEVTFDVTGYSHHKHPNEARGRILSSRKKMQVDGRRQATELCIVALHRGAASWRRGEMVGNEEVAKSIGTRHLGAWHTPTSWCDEPSLL